MKEERVEFNIAMDTAMPGIGRLMIRMIMRR